MPVRTERLPQGLRGGLGGTPGFCSWRALAASAESPHAQEHALRAGRGEPRGLWQKAGGAGRHALWGPGTAPALFPPLFCMRSLAVLRNCLESRLENAGSRAPPLPSPKLLDQKFLRGQTLVSGCSGGQPGQARAGHRPERPAPALGRAQPGLLLRGRLGPAGRMIPGAPSDASGPHTPWSPSPARSCVKLWESARLSVVKGRDAPLKAV